MGKGIVAVCAFTALICLSGCGGGGGSKNNTNTSANRGQARVTIYWPEPSKRLVPLAANSIKVSLSKSGQGQPIATQIARRPATGSGETTLTFTLLEPGEVRLSAAAYPGADGTGIPQASGETTATISPGIVTNTDLTLATTIKRLTLSPASVTVRVKQSAKLDRYRV